MSCKVLPFQEAVCTIGFISPLSIWWNLPVKFSASFLCQEVDIVPYVSVPQVSVLFFPLIFFLYLFF